MSLNKPTFSKWASVDTMTLEQKIHLWKALPLESVDETDVFINQLITKIDELKDRVDELVYEGYGDDL